MHGREKWNFILHPLGATSYERPRTRVVPFASDLYIIRLPMDACQSKKRCSLQVRIRVRDASALAVERVEFLPYEAKLHGKRVGIVGLDRIADRSATERETLYVSVYRPQKEFCKFVSYTALRAAHGNCVAWMRV